jgi:hypothetical protein
MSKNTDLGNLVNGLFVSSTRNVGIGMSTPANAVVVDKGTATASYLQFTAGTTTGQLATDGFEVGIDASGNAIISQQENLPLMVYTNSAERLRINAVGNVGIGVIPSSWSVGRAFELGNLGNGLWNASAADTRLMTNVYFNGGFFYGSNGVASIMETGDGFIWRTAPIGTANASATFTERMRITSAGNVGIGTSSPTIFGGGMEIQRASQAALRVSCTTGTLAGGAEFGYEGSQGAFIQTVQANGQFSIYTGNASVLAMRITSGGQVSIGTTTTVSTYLLNVKAQTGAQAINITGRDNADGAGVLQWTNQFGTYLGYIEVNSTALYVARGSGGVYITTNATSWTSNSDSRLKNIISPINNAVDKLSTLNPVIYSWKSDNTNKENIGLIAQDVEAIFPQVIDTNKDGFLGVRYTELVPVLVKAIQELSAKITILENK